MEHLITVASEHAATWALTIATVHLAHRSLPDERKHWIRQRVRAVVTACRRAPDGDE